MVDTFIYHWQGMICVSLKDNDPILSLIIDSANGAGAGVGLGER